MRPNLNLALIIVTKKRNREWHLEKKWRAVYLSLGVVVVVEEVIELLDDEDEDAIAAPEEEEEEH